MTTPPASRPFATAQIIAVGSEMLTPFKADSNSLTVTARLEEWGVQVRGKSIVGDERADLAAALLFARERADLVVFIGGLGPTGDDITREVVAEVLDRPLAPDDTILETIARRFASRGIRMPDVNRRQAMVPHGAVPLANPNGTAPGLWIDEGQRGVLLLPGPPRELEHMMETFARDVLSTRTGAERLYRRVIKIAGRAESHVEEVTKDTYSRWRDARPPISTTILAAPGQIELHLSLRLDDERAAGAQLDQAVAEVSAVLGPDVFSVDGRSLDQVVGALLRQSGWRIGVAESCTGGLVASRLTDVPGSSDYLQAAVVAYSNAAKVELLGVPAALIVEHGAVSEPVAVAMAEGVRHCARAEVGIGVTGIAGPAGGTPGKPVGTVAIAVAVPDASVRVRTFRFPGGRALVKAQAAQAALDQVRRAILEVRGQEHPHASVRRR